MNIQILYGKDGAKNAEGTVVIIDVFRAATVASVVLAIGADRVLPVATAEEAFALKKQYPSAIITGEERGIMIPGFDVGNSPYDLEVMDLVGKTVIQRTSAGTQGLTLAAQRLNGDVNEVLFGAFTTLSALATYLNLHVNNTLTIVAMDGQDTEDGYFASCLKDTIEGKSVRSEEVRAYLSTHPKAAHFFNKEVTSHSTQDFDICVDVDRYDFIVGLKKRDVLELVPIHL